MVRWDSFLVLDLALNVVDGVGRLNLEGDGLASNCRRKYVSILLCGDVVDEVVVDCRGQVAWRSTTSTSDKEGLTSLDEDLHDGNF